MSDYDDLRLARIGGLLDNVEAKAATPGKKKVKPRPPWLDDDAEDQTDGGDDAAEDEDKPGRRNKKALPAKPPASFKGKGKPAKENLGKVRRRQTVTSPRGNLARVQHQSRGTSVSMRTLPAPKGFKAKALHSRSIEAGRPTVWGPQSRSVDIRRVNTPGTGSDARLNAARGTHAESRLKKPGTGRAGGNGVTAGRGDVHAPRVAPGNVRGRRGGSQVSHSGQMGNGAAWGRSGSAVIPHKPANIKSLYDFSPDELRSAMDVAAKAIRGVLRDFEAADR